MASFFSSVGQKFTRNPNKGNQPSKSPGLAPSPTYSSGSSLSAPPPSIAPIPQSPALSAGMSFDNASNPENLPPAPTNSKPPFFFRDEYSGLIVKGNFMTLAAKPVHVEEGEWLAHQVVEQYRLLDGMVQIIRVADERTGKAICNPDVCPTMSASGHTYTWLDNNKRPIKIPACQYIQLVQKWILGKISDSSLFPTDTPNPSSNASSYASGSVSTPSSTPPIPVGPTNLNASLSQLAGRDWMGKSSGFPETFESDIKSIYRQMMRCYAHLYHGHWLEPFWHINAYKELNTCFIHFVNVGRLFSLIGEKEIEPMAPLIDLWLQKGLLPQLPAKEGQQGGSTQGQAQQQQLGHQQAHHHQQMASA